MKKKLCSVVCLTLFCSIFGVNQVFASEIESTVSARVPGDLVLREVPDFNFGVVERGGHTGPIAGNLSISDDRITHKGWSLQVKENGTFEENGLSIYLSWANSESEYIYSTPGIVISSEYENFITAPETISSDNYFKTFELHAGLEALSTANSGEQTATLTWNLVSGPS